MVGRDKFTILGRRVGIGAGTFRTIREMRLTKGRGLETNARLFYRGRDPGNGGAGFGLEVVCDGVGRQKASPCHFFYHSQRIA
jgi:hypothetical protein